MTRHWKFPGAARLARLLVKQRSSNGEPAFDGLVAFCGGLIQCNTLELIEYHIFSRLRYEPEVAGIIQSLARPGQVCIDVGANVGVHTLTMAKAVGDSGRVIAVEPQPTCLQRLRSNVALNRYTNVTILSCALNSHDGSGQLSTFPGYSHLATLDESPVRIGVSTPRPIEVAMRRGDRVVDELALDRIDLIKIDTEGWEIDVLRGFAHSIARFSPLVILEYEPQYWARSNTNWHNLSDVLPPDVYTFWHVLEEGLVRIQPGREPLPGTLLALPSSAAIADV